MDSLIQLLEGAPDDGALCTACNGCCAGLGACGGGCTGCPRCGAPTTPDQRLAGLGGVGTAGDVVAGLFLLAVTAYTARAVLGAEMAVERRYKRRRPLMTRIRRSRTTAQVWG